MKKIYLIIAFVFVLTESYSQSYSLLANDPAGDPTQSFAPDIKSLSYRTDVAEDSIWFKVQTYNAVDPNGDVGLMFGLDTNMITTDGIAWNGTNHSMKYDIAFLVFQDVISPNYYGFLYSSSGSMQIPTVVLRPDSFTFIISTTLTLLDQDGNFNLLFGSGAFDILSTRSVFDDVPNTGFITVSAVTAVSEARLMNQSICVYPNPASRFIRVNQSNKKHFNYHVFSSQGAEVLKGQSGDEQTVDLTGLCGGMYLFQMTDEQDNVRSTVFVKTNN